MFDLTKAEGGFGNESRESYRELVLEKYLHRGSERNVQPAALHVYIARGRSLIPLTAEGVDCTPVEDFYPGRRDQELLRSAIGKVLKREFRDRAQNTLS